MKTVVVTALLCLLSNGCWASSSAEASLVRQLMSAYDRAGVKHARPVANHSSPVHVDFGLALISVLAVDDARETLALRVWERYSWKDEFLTWNATEHHGIRVLRVSASRLWRPDLTVYNAQREEERSETLAVVYSTGHVLWIPPATYNVRCSFQKTHLEIQESCFIKIGSWTYDGNKFQLGFYEEQKEISLNDYAPSNDIEITDASAKKNVLYYPCCNEPYEYLTFKLSFLRPMEQSVRLTYSLLVCLSVTSLSIFWLPPSFSARLILGGIALLGHVLVLILAAILPPEGRLVYSYASQIIKVIITTCVMIGCSLLSLVLYDKAQDRCSLPDFVRKVFLGCLSRILCVQQPKKSESECGETYKRRASQQQLMNDLETSQIGDEKSAVVWDNIERELRQISSVLGGRETARCLQYEWGIVAKVCDRLFFIIFLIALIILIALIM